MNKSVTYNVVITGLMVALGLLLPFFTSHAFGVPGTIALPMHMPVLLCGLLCGPRYGALAGAVIPALSSVVTGMPPIYPMLPIMAAQLIICGLSGGVLYRKARWNIYPALGVSIVSGWALYGSMYGLLLLWGNGQLQALSVTAAIMQGLPGLTIQMVLIPVLVKALERLRRRGQTAAGENKALEEAKALIRQRDVSFVVMKHGRIIHTAGGRGVSSILWLFDSEPEMLYGADVADKIIGKAAAMILTAGHVKSAYGEIMSMAARDYFAGHGVSARFGRCVDVITAGNEKGICPIEKSVLEIDDPAEAIATIRAAVARLTEKAM